VLSGAFFVDSHVHCYPSVPFASFLDHAARNFAAGAERCGCRPAAAWLLLTETAADNAFAALAVLPGCGQWLLRATAEPISLVAEAPTVAFPIILVAGRQLVTGEGLEVLAIGTADTFADGQDLEATIAAVKAAGALAILPWGFGKWWGRRGRILAERLEAAAPGTLFLGDNGGRPALASQPRAFATAARRNIPVLPGSDPLPLAAEATTCAGRYGFVLEAVVDAGRPAEGLKDRLLALREQPPSFGRRQALLPFVQRQLGMQWRKRSASR
jgi:hypothetical protein